MSTERMLSPTWGRPRSIGASSGDNPPLRSAPPGSRARRQLARVGCQRHRCYKIGSMLQQPKLMGGKHDRRREGDNTICVDRDHVPGWALWREDLAELGSTTIVKVNDLCSHAAKCNTCSVGHTATVVTDGTPGVLGSRP